MPADMEQFKDFLIEHGCSDKSLPVDLAWVSQQPKGAAEVIMSKTKALEEYLNGHRQDGN